LSIALSFNNEDIATISQLEPTLHTPLFRSVGKLLHSTIRQPLHTSPTCVVDEFDQLFQITRTKPLM